MGIFQNYGLQGSPNDFLETIQCLAGYFVFLMLLLLIFSNSSELKIQMNKNIQKREGKGEW